MDRFNVAVYEWFATNQRQLPWRNTQDPYLIWLSEVILQQTRVAQGLPYYIRLTERFPDVASLADASEDELVKLWEGLGYYSRARNLHAAAKSILINYKGMFPCTWEEIRKLRGVGDYTAAAVASIAFGLPHAVVDGNVVRVLSRYFGIKVPYNSTEGRKQFHTLAHEILHSGDPGMHNQAIMEFGALHCTHGKPDCEKCPLHASCYAFEHGEAGRLPVRTIKPDKQFRFFIFVAAINGSYIHIQKRMHKDIWRNLYQFPLLELASGPDVSAIPDLPEMAELLKTPGCQLVSVSRLFTQQLTHRRVYARFVHVFCDELPSLWGETMQVNQEEMYKFAFPVLIRKYLAENSLLDLSDDEDGRSK